MGKKNLSMLSLMSWIKESFIYIYNSYNLNFLNAMLWCIHFSELAFFVSTLLK